MPRDEDDDYDRPARRPRRRDDDYDDRPRRRRRSEDEEDETGGLIPYKNAKALSAYYLGVFSLIPCIGGVLAVLALVFGFQGLTYAKTHPKARGQAHAYVGIVLGTLVLLGHLAAVAFIVVAAASAKR